MSGPQGNFTQFNLTKSRDKCVNALIPHLEHFSLITQQQLYQILESKNFALYPLQQFPIADRKCMARILDVWKSVPENHFEFLYAWLQKELNNSMSKYSSHSADSNGSLLKQTKRILSGCF